MQLAKCPLCEGRVLPKADGRCPACSHPIPKTSLFSNDDEPSPTMDQKQKKRNTPLKPIVKSHITLAIRNIPALLEKLYTVQRSCFSEEDAEQVNQQLPAALTFNCPLCGILDSASVFAAASVNSIKTMEDAPPVAFGGPNVATLAKGQCPGCGLSIVEVSYDPAPVLAVSVLLENDIETTRRCLNLQANNLFDDIRMQTTANHKQIIPCQSKKRLPACDWMHPIKTLLDRRQHRRKYEKALLRCHLLSEPSLRPNEFWETLLFVLEGPYVDFRYSAWSWLRGCHFQGSRAHPPEAFFSLVERELCSEQTEDHSLDLECVVGVITTIYYAYSQSGYHDKQGPAVKAMKRLVAIFERAVAGEFGSKVVEQCKVNYEAIRASHLSAQNAMQRLSQ